MMYAVRTWLEGRKSSNSGSNWLLVICGLLLTAVLMRLFGDLSRVLTGQMMLHDDAYYYLVVAKNFVQSGKMTFDGISLTNGYHPLLFWIEVLMYLTGGLHLPLIGQVLAVVCIQQTIFTLTVIMILRWIIRNRETYKIETGAMLAALVFLLYPKHVSVFMGGMESNLVFPFLTLFLYYTWKERPGLAGLFAALLVLSRLDTLIFIVFPITLIVSIKGSKSFGTFLKRGITVGGPALLVTLILMAVYQVVFGHPTPVSGACRSSFPVPHVQWHLITNYFVNAFVDKNPEVLAMINSATAGLILAICGMMIAWTGRLSSGQKKAAWILIGCGLIQLLNFLMFQKWAKPLPPWYLAPTVIFCCGAIGSAAANLINQRRLVGICLAMAALVVLLNGQREYRYFKTPFVPAKGDVTEFTVTQPENTVWAATDCGRLAFWTGLRFVNLDGLINGFEYQAALRDKKLANYLKEMGVRYLIVGVWEREQAYFFEPMYAHRVDPAAFKGDYDTFDYYVYSYMYETYSDHIKLRRDQEVWRGEAHLDSTSMSRAVIFDLTR